jgi:hypothetical protein
MAMTGTLGDVPSSFRADPPRGHQDSAKAAHTERPWAHPVPACRSQAGASSPSLRCRPHGARSAMAPTSLPSSGARTAPSGRTGAPTPARRAPLRRPPGRRVRDAAHAGAASAQSGRAAAAALGRGLQHRRLLRVQHELAVRRRRATLSAFSQMMAIGGQSVLSAGVGLATGMAVVRGFTSRSGTRSATSGSIPGERCCSCSCRSRRWERCCA